MQTVDLLALRNTKNIGDDALLKLIRVMRNNHLDSFESLSTVESQLDILSKPARTALQSLLSTDNCSEARNAAAHQADQLRANHITVIPFGSELYPLGLSALKKPPPLLFCKGNLSLLQTTKNVAVVGSRNSTKRGETITQRTVAALAPANFNIVSGLALGIDTAAHAAALDCHIPTIAVLVDVHVISPATNRGLAEDILDHGGLLIAENPPNTKVIPAFFAKRDRIQSGLSCGVFAIETAIDGGTMHAVKAAQEINRPVYVPDAARANYEDLALNVISGTQHLVKTGQAVAYTAADYGDIISSLSALSQQISSLKAT